MEKKSSKTKAILKWMQNDLPDNAPLMIIICAFSAGLGLASAIFMIGLVIKLLMSIFY